MESKDPIIINEMIENKIYFLHADNKGSNLNSLIHYERIFNDRLYSRHSFQELKPIIYDKYMNKKSIIVLSKNSEHMEKCNDKRIKFYNNDESKKHSFINEKFMNNKFLMVIKDKTYSVINKFDFNEDANLEEFENNIKNGGIPDTDIKALVNVEYIFPIKPKSNEVIDSISKFIDSHLPDKNIAIHSINILHKQKFTDKINKINLVIQIDSNTNNNESKVNNRNDTNDMKLLIIEIEPEKDSELDKYVKLKVKMNFYPESENIFKMFSRNCIIFNSQEFHNFCISKEDFIDCLESNILIFNQSLIEERLKVNCKNLDFSYKIFESIFNQILLYNNIGSLEKDFLKKMNSYYWNNQSISLNNNEYFYNLEILITNFNLNITSFKESLKKDEKFKEKIKHRTFYVLNEMISETCHISKFDDQEFDYMINKSKIKLENVFKYENSSSCFRYVLVNKEGSNSLNVKHLIYFNTTKFKSAEHVKFLKDFSTFRNLNIPNTFGDLRIFNLSDRFKDLTAQISLSTSETRPLSLKNCLVITYDLINEENKARSYSEIQNLLSARFKFIHEYKFDENNIDDSKLKLKIYTKLIETFMHLKMNNINHFNFSFNSIYLFTDKNDNGPNKTKIIVDFPFPFYNYNLLPSCLSICNAHDFNLINSGRFSEFNENETLKLKNDDDYINQKSLKSKVVDNNFIEIFFNVYYFLENIENIDKKNKISNIMLKENVYQRNHENKLFKFNPKKVYLEYYKIAKKYAENDGNDNKKQLCEVMKDFFNFYFDYTDQEKSKELNLLELMKKMKTIFETINDNNYDNLFKIKPTNQKLMFLKDLYDFNKTEETEQTYNNEYKIIERNDTALYFYNYFDEFDKDLIINFKLEGNDNEGNNNTKDYKMYLYLAVYLIKDKFEVMLNADESINKDDKNNENNIFDIIKNYNETEYKIQDYTNKIKDLEISKSRYQSLEVEDTDFSNENSSNCYKTFMIKFTTNVFDFSQVVFIFTKALTIINESSYDRNIINGFLEILREHLINYTIIAKKIIAFENTDKRDLDGNICDLLFISLNNFIKLKIQFIKIDLYPSKQDETKKDNDYLEFIKPLTLISDNINLIIASLALKKRRMFSVTVNKIIDIMFNLIKDIDIILKNP